LSLRLPNQGWPLAWCPLEERYIGAATAPVADSIVKPSVSIITPSFNRLEWLPLAVASVADQQNIEVEHIIQDSLSEGVEQVYESRIAGLANPSHHIRFCMEKDAGMYDAVNRGLAKASGEICAWLNCDEQYLPGTLRRISAVFAARPEIDIVFGDVLITDANGKALTYRRAILPSARHIRLSHLNTFSCATFFRRRFFTDGPPLNPEWKSIGDAIWIYDLLKKGVAMAIYPELLSVFTLTGANLSTDDPVSEKEKARWLAQPDAPSKTWRPFETALHRTRKLLARAYAKRSFDYEIYTLQSPTGRVRFAAQNIGGSWPG
jgi:glycosyltransferase involved in cell wall biosynthesis